MTAAESQALFGVLPEAMMLAALDGRIVAANDAAASLLDGGNRRLTGTSIAALATDPPVKVVRTLALFSRSGQFVPAALTFKTEAGEIRCRVEGALVQLSEGPLLVLRVLPRDQAVSRFRSLNERIETLNREVFERKQVAETSDRLRAIVDSSDDAIVSKDLNGIIKTWNKTRVDYECAFRVDKAPLAMLGTIDRIAINVCVLRSRSIRRKPVARADTDRSKAFGEIPAVAELRRNHQLSSTVDKPKLTIPAY